jgi:hypothetical protein
MVSEAMKVMDEGYLAQGYYRRLKAKIPLENADAKKPTLMKITVGLSTYAESGDNGIPTQKCCWNSWKSGDST